MKSAQCGEKIYLSQYHPLEYEGLTLDFNRGTITCSGMKSDKILEYVTLSFSVALLHVLCVPRPTKWKSGESLKPKLAKRGRRRLERFPDEDMSFMMAAGLLYLTPSNHYIYHNYGANVSAGCSAGGIVSDSCGVGFDQSQCVINSDGGDFGGGGGGDIGGGDGGGGCGGCGGCGGGCGGGGGSSGGDGSGGGGGCGSDGGSGGCGGGGSCGGGGGCGGGSGCGGD